MYFSPITARLWLNFYKHRFWGAAFIRGRRLLEGSSGLSVNGEVLIRGWHLFETWLLIKEKR